MTVAGRPPSQRLAAVDAELQVEDGPREAGLLVHALVQDLRGSRVGRGMRGAPRMKSTEVRRAQSQALDSGGARHGHRQGLEHLLGGM